MPYLKKVNIKGHDYFYLFHTVRDKANKEKYNKLSKYIGKTKPSKGELEKLKTDFLEEIQHKSPVKNEPVTFNKNVIAELQEIQDKKGYLSIADMKKVSEKDGLPGVDICSVATFYSQFKLKKPGKHKISICTGTACHVKGSADLLEYLEKTLKIKPGEKTRDGRITLEHVNCIGACAKAPAMMVDNTVYGELTKEKIKTIIDSLK